MAGYWFDCGHCNTFCVYCEGCSEILAPWVVLNTKMCFHHLMRISLLTFEIWKMFLIFKERTPKLNMFNCLFNPNPSLTTSSEIIHLVCDLVCAAGLDQEAGNRGLDLILAPINSYWDAETLSRPYRRFVNKSNIPAYHKEEEKSMILKTNCQRYNKPRLWNPWLR